MLATASSALLLIGLVAAHPAADVVRIEVQSRADVVNRRTFATAGHYEKIAGRIFFEIVQCGWPGPCGGSYRRRPTTAV